MTEEIRSDRAIHNARQLAAEILLRARPAGPFVADLLDEMTSRAQIKAHEAQPVGLASDATTEPPTLDARDRHLAHELAAGVVRHRRTLDAVIDGFARRPLVKSPPALRVLVRLGAYQLLFLDRIPDHAAVDQTVELAKQWARPRMKKHPASIASFTNGLLRAIAAGRQMVASAAGQNIRRVIERPGGFVLIDRDVFADPQASPGEYLADAYSFDPWLAERWVARLGLAKARELAQAQNRRAGLTLRVNTLRTTPDAVREMLAGEGVPTKPVRAPARHPSAGHAPLWPGNLLRVLDGDALASKAMHLGLIQPQDPWAASVAPKLDLKSGLTVLDRCAAPGTKTTQIVELMADKGLVLAVGQDAEGVDRVTTSAKRMGDHIVRTMLAEEMPAQLLAIQAAGRGIDRVLVDAPCSNSGVLARRPEARWRLDADSLARLAHTQRELLMDALNWVSPAGKVVYATCSIEPEENEQVVQYAINRRHGQARLLDERLTLPSVVDDHDGGYWALIERVR